MSRNGFVKYDVLAGVLEDGSPVPRYSTLNVRLAPPDDLAVALEIASPDFRQVLPVYAEHIADLSASSNGWTFFGLGASAGTAAVASAVDRVLAGYDLELSTYGGLYLHLRSTFGAPPQQALLMIRSRVETATRTWPSDAFDAEDAAVPPHVTGVESRLREAEEQLASWEAEDGQTLSFPYTTDQMISLAIILASKHTGHQFSPEFIVAVARYADANPVILERLIVGAKAFMMKKAFDAIDGIETDEEEPTLDETIRWALAQPW